MKSIFEKISKDKINDIDINDYMKYLVMERKLSENSVYSYYNDLAKLSITTKKNLKDLSSKEIREYLNNLNESDRSVAHTITAFKSFYKFLIINKKINNNPMALISPPKLSKKIPKVLNVSEIEKLLDIKLENEFDYRNKAMLELMYGSFIQAVINFLIIAFCIFIFVKAMNKLNEKLEKIKKKEKAEEETSAKSEEVILLEEIRDLLKKEKKNSKN